MNTPVHAPHRASPFALAQHWRAQDTGPSAADLTLTDRSLQIARWGCKGPSARPTRAARVQPLLRASDRWPDRALGCYRIPHRSRHRYA